MKDYKENFYNAIDYAVNKTKATAWRLILLGVMGSIYVAIAYVAFIMVLAQWNGTIIDTPIMKPGTQEIIFSVRSINISGGALISAAAIFPVGIMLIIFLGGSLFTSDNLTSIAWITKKVKLLPILVKWFYTLVGNILGALLAGAIIRAGNILGSLNYQMVLGYLAGKKIGLEWYYTIFSGILCNIIVAGSVWASLAAKHSTAKLFIIYFPIWLFAIAGFQHVVANVILFSMTWFYSINPEEQKNVLAGINFAANHLNYIPDYVIYQKVPNNINEINEWLNDKNLNNEYKFNINVKEIEKNWITINKFSFKAIFLNLIPATIGNWFSGAILLPYTYYWLSQWRKTNNPEDKNLNKIVSNDIREIDEISRNMHKKNNNFRNNK